MKKILLIIICVLMLSGCHPRPPIKHHHRPPLTGDPVADIIIGVVIVSSIIAAEIIDSQLNKEQ